MSKRGALLDRGCGATSKSLVAMAVNAASKKKKKVVTSKVSA